MERKIIIDNAGLNSITAVMLVTLLFINTVHAELALNFLPNSNVVNSVANQSCNTGNGSGMMGGMGGGMGGMMGMSVGPGCGNGYFLQQIVNDNGAQYYHVIVGDPAQDDFALEFYMRTGGCCWWTGSGMMGGMGGGMMGSGGDAPYSSSYGNVNDRLFNAYQPLSNNTAAGNASGNPSRVYMRQINNDPNMTQEFIKPRELNKPRITQTVRYGNTMSATFDLDLTNGNYGTYSNPARFTNITNVTGVVSYNAAASPQADVTAGRYRYSPGNSFNGSLGTYTYESGGFNIYGINWLSYCDPSQNSDHRCIFNSNNNGGGMIGGMMGGMGM